MSEYKVVIEIDIDKKQFDKQSEYQQRLLLADYIYTLAEGNELDFQIIDKNQRSLWHQLNYQTNENNN